MVAYRTSDIKMNWQHPQKGDMGGAPLTCGYVKEGLGKCFHEYNFRNIINFFYFQS